MGHVRNLSTKWHRCFLKDRHFSCKRQRHLKTLSKKDTAHPITKVRVLGSEIPNGSRGRGEIQQVEEG